MTSQSHVTTTSIFLGEIGSAWLSIASALVLPMSEVLF